MIVHLAGAALILAGFLCISLSMRRHGVLIVARFPAIVSITRRPTMLRLFGWCFVVASAAILIGSDPQLGALYWTAYGMAAAIAVVALHTWAERRP